MSELERLFLLQVKAHGMPEPQTEYKFHDARRWRFDLAWPEHNPPVAVEIEGGIWNGGRHVTGAGFEKDSEKYNKAAEMGWTVLRYTPRYVRNGEAVLQVKRVLGVV